MQVTILTLPFDPTTGRFRTEPLDALCRRSEALLVGPAFFRHQETPCWTMVVTHRLRAVPGEAAARRGWSKRRYLSGSWVEHSAPPPDEVQPLSTGAGAAVERRDSSREVDVRVRADRRVWRAESAWKELLTCRGNVKLRSMLGPSWLSPVR